MINLLRSNTDIWDLFSRKEEYDSKEHDEYGRFPSRASRNTSIGIPIVSKFLYEHGMRVHYPENHDFALCLTHDIDLLNHPLSIRMLRLLGNPRSMNSILNRLNEKINPNWRFDYIAQLEQEYGGKSTFFFLNLDMNNDEFNYSCEDVNQQMGNLIDEGFEVGLHGSHQAYCNGDILHREKASLERIIGANIKGFRNHYLRFEIPTTWRLLDDSGFLYDSTFGFSDEIGFRNGMCHPFRPYDRNREMLMNILEIPLVATDQYLLGAASTGIDTIWDKMKRLIDECKKYNGVITIVWHNGGRRESVKWKAYRKLIKYCHENGAWLTSAEEIHSWWKRNNFP